MAKSKGFFTLRRGSTKSLTFQVVDGQQITKDRVSSVHNPRTMKQQYQRAIMATVMAAYSNMKAIENHAFQGKSKGKANQREFMRLNLNSLRSKISADVAAGRAAADCTGFVNFPKSNDLVPNEYIIAKGSLPPQQFFGVGADYSAVDEDGKLILSPNLRLSDVTTYTIGMLFNKWAISPGTQITLVWSDLQTSETKMVPGSGQAAGWGYKPGKFHFQRIVFKKDIDLNASHTFAANTELAKWAELFPLIIDIEKTTFELTPLEGDNRVEIELESDLDWYDATLCGMFGIITSIVDSDERADAVMHVSNASQNIAAHYTGLTWDAIPIAWQEYIALGNSELYLEGGE